VSFEVSFAIVMVLFRSSLERGSKKTLYYREVRIYLRTCDEGSEKKQAYTACAGTIAPKEITLWQRGLGWK
jgi:hypothetical protein